MVAVTVAATFTGTRLLGRRLGVPGPRSLLIATGFSICGASAVAAMEPVAGGDEEDTGVAVALVTLCGSLAIVILPLLRVPLGLDVAQFGSWAGASVHDVGQTVATAQRVPGSLTTAVVVKLTRVVLLAPLVAVWDSVRAGPARCAAGGGHRPPPVPLFVAGFLAAVALTSSGVLPHAVLATARAGPVGAAGRGPVRARYGDQRPLAAHHRRPLASARPGVLAAGGRRRLRGRRGRGSVTRRQGRRRSEGSGHLGGGNAIMPV